MKDFATETMTCGLDLGDQWSHVCLLDGAGEIVEESRIRMTQTALLAFFSGREPMRVVFEVGTHSRWVDRLLGTVGHETVVANARRVQLISRNERKTDRVDAELLARLGRVDPELLKPVRHRAESAQRDLIVVRARAALMRARTLLINCVRGQVKSTGARIKSCSADAFGKRLAEIPETLRSALEPMMDQIRKLTAEIRSYDKRLNALAADDVEIANLRTHNGVGSITAVTFVRTLEDPNRYASGRAAAAFLGLVPRRAQSGRSDPQLRITKSGDRYLRQLLVNCAQYILGPFGSDSALRRWGLKLRERGGKNAKKRAVVAVARKLAVALFRLWKSGDVYQPFPRALPN
jgi:transposase